MASDVVDSTNRFERGVGLCGQDRDSNDAEPVFSLSLSHVLFLSEFKKRQEEAARYTHAKPISTEICAPSYAEMAPNYASIRVLRHESPR